ncbi:hypothetical protein K438DRAFT_1787378 [Mycena galopus ATCC 62051]|nr:hypothetical protein K438DRAFT_1787378 [Mycena galopus ATCC 62051]
MPSTPDPLRNLLIKPPTLPAFPATSGVSRPTVFGATWPLSLTNAALRADPSPLPALGPLPRHCVLNAAANTLIGSDVLKLTPAPPLPLSLILVHPKGTPTRRVRPLLSTLHGFSLPLLRLPLPLRSLARSRALSDPRYGWLPSHYFNSYWITTHHPFRVPKTNARGIGEMNGAFWSSEDPRTSLTTPPGSACLRRQSDHITRDNLTVHVASLQQQTITRALHSKRVRLVCSSELPPAPEFDTSNILRGLVLVYVEFYACSLGLVQRKGQSSRWVIFLVYEATLSDLAAAYLAVYRPTRPSRYRHAAFELYIPSTLH